MKKIICLFLMATTLSLASAPATIHVEADQTSIQTLYDTELDKFSGGLPTWACVAAVGIGAYGGFQTGGLLGGIIAGPGGATVGGIIGGVIGAAAAASACNS
jgi:hypothetical protein